VEGGSANDYVYCSGDPINCTDLGGTMDVTFCLLPGVDCEYDANLTYPNGAAAEGWFNGTVLNGQGVRTPYATPVGERIPDFTFRTTIYEVKSGYITNSKRIRKQANQDKLLLDTGRVSAVEWHFYPGRYGVLLSGPTFGLIYNLRAKGFRVVLHFPARKCGCNSGPFIG
jgi:hypothetical protein